MKKVIYFNLPNHILFSSSSLSVNLFPEYCLLRLLAPVSYIDRTDTLKLPYSYHVITKIPQYKDISLSFDEIVNLQSKEIIEKSDNENKEIALLWSGGIDSTVALLGIHSVLPKDKNIFLIHTDESIKEFSSLYKNYILKQKNIVLNKVDSINYNILSDSNKLYVTGELGDQIFGSMLMINFYAAKNGIMFQVFDKNQLQQVIDDLFLNKSLSLEFLNNSWQEEINEYFYNIKIFNDGSAKIINPNNIEKFIEIVGEQTKHCPFEIITLFDFLWWVNFTLKWQDVQLRITANTGLKKKHFFNNFIHFFDNELFQLWSMKKSNHEKKIKDNLWKNYKIIAKEYINTVFECKKYLETKTKIPSLRNMSQSISTTNIYNTDVKIIYL